jgi:hypothetical protein
MRWCRPTSGIRADGEVVWSWHPLAGAKLATMLCIAPMTVTKTSRTPGRARSKPLKPSRRECRRKRRTCSDYARVLFDLHARLWVRAPRPAFPAPSDIGGHVDGTTRARSRRGSEIACPGCSAPSSGAQLIRGPSSCSVHTWSQLCGAPLTKRCTASGTRELRNVAAYPSRRRANAAPQDEVIMCCREPGGMDRSDLAERETASA